MSRYAYDIEIFKNFISIYFVNIEDDFDEVCFWSIGEIDFYGELKDFLSTPKTLIGYNNLHFDNPILNAVLEGWSISEVFKLALDIVNSEVNKKYEKTGYKSIDLMLVNNLNNKSLKKVGLSLNWYKIQELPIDPESTVKEDQVDLILSYNRNDVLLTKKLYKESLGEISIREDMSNLYGIDLINTSRSRLANVILEYMYSKKSGRHRNDFINLRTPRSRINVSDCLCKDIRFTSEVLKEKFEKIKGMKITSDSRFSDTVKYKGKVYELGVGGLHSKDNPGIFRSLDYQIIDADVSSFYPKIILLNNIKPAHLGDIFLEIYKELTQERLKAKSEGKKLKADGLKIAINSVFGKLGHENFWLYDPQAFYSVTISGQLYLLMLIEMLEEGGIEVISANTDGVVSKVYDEKRYIDICNQWSELTQFELERTYYDLYVRRDVNNYISRTIDGKIKRKGIFDTEIDLSKGFHTPIIGKTLESYFLDGQPIDLKSQDIYDYLISQQVGQQFNIFIKRNGRSEKIQKVSRFYVSYDGWEIFKSDGHREISICSHPVQIANEITDSSNINKDYYKAEIIKIIEKIEPVHVQMELW